VGDLKTLKRREIFPPNETPLAALRVEGAVCRNNGGAKYQEQYEWIM
jgi:hypothetical protein